jgi:hypothetical protein
METTAIRPTVTHQVRAFLSSQGAGLGPAAGLDETYAELYGLLSRRRDDPALWGPLAALLRDLQRTALDPANPARLPAPQAELLASWDIEGLVRDLRRAVPGGEPTRELAQIGKFLSGLSTAVMGGFLVIGLAATTGCTPDCVEGECVGGQECCDDDGNYAGSCRSQVLDDAVGGSSMTDAEKGELCSCFARLSASWVGGLESLFETGTPEEIATALDRIAQCCTYAGFDESSSYTDDFLDSYFCEEAQPAYKGVSFGRSRA